MKHLAVITARSGSKGLKDKNIKLLEGKPLLVYSVEAAEQSGEFDCIHVSTDSEKYQRFARGAVEPDVSFFQSNAALARGHWPRLFADIQILSNNPKEASLWKSTLRMDHEPFVFRSGEQRRVLKLGCLTC